MAKSARLSRRSQSSVASGATSRAKKISITVDEHVLRAVAQEARRAGRTLSSHVTEALARDLRNQRLRAIIEGYEAEHGAITDEELASVRAQWEE